MVRVLIISVLAFGALVLVTQALPVPDAPAQEAGSRPGTGKDPATVPPAATATVAEAPVSADSAETFPEGVGRWEGAFNTYDLNGTRVSSVFRRVERVASDIGFDVTVSNIDGEKATLVVRKHLSFEGNAATSREFDEQHRVRVVKGRVTGSAILWHYEDPVTGIRTVRREEILPSGLYTIDGVGVVGDEVRFYEGRYKRQP